ncbi:hypothetical protein C0583_06040 [Candidatus Parcubacteria bacterium]|nr:MAG: hypothetical protein C0583_06040 [Candidatus Parcubacteria bacterium]
MGQVKSLVAKEAMQILNLAYNETTERMLNASIKIVNVSGVEIARSIMENMSPGLSNEAFLKARQSLWTGESTKYCQRALDERGTTPEIMGIQTERFICEGGGVPIYNGQSLIGAIGISLDDENNEGAHDIAFRSVVQAGFSTQKN